MAHYAKRIRYGADDEVGVYVALVAIAKKKGGKPIKFVLYRFLSVGPKGMFESVEFSGSQEKEAEESFPSGPITYRPIEEEFEWNRDLIEQGVILRGRINPWKETTNWLNCIAAGGSHRAYPDGAWVKLRKRPYTWRKDGPRKKKKLRLKFGSLEHRLLAVREEIACLKGRISEKKVGLPTLHRKYNEANGKERWRLLFDNIATDDELTALEDEVEILEAKESGLIAEMTYVRDKKFPSTVSP